MLVNFETTQNNDRKFYRVSYPHLSIFTHNSETFSVDNLSAEGIAFHFDDEEFNYNINDYIAFDLFVHETRFVLQAMAHVVRRRDNICGCKVFVTGGERRKLDRLITLLQGYEIIRKNNDERSTAVQDFRASLYKLLKPQFLVQLHGAMS